MASINAKTTLSRLYNSSQLLKGFHRCKSTRAPQSVFIENTIEDPVIVVNERDDVDLIGPPDPISNLRPVVRKTLINETALQQRLRELQGNTMAWNQEFWAKHNTNFIKEKQEFIDKNQTPGEEKKQLTADEMSEFYKTFLDKNWTNHVNYNREWYKKNFTMLFLALQVNIEKHLAKLL